MKPIINLSHVTKDYGKGRGIFDINLEIKEGEVFGIVGVNGSGKTTTIRSLMGFIKPTAGKIRIKQYDAWKDAAKIKRSIGYVPGEIAFPDTKTGVTFLQMQSRLLHLKNPARTNQLIQALKLDTDANIKRMSKGMKQKTAIVDAFMADPEILLLDEPTTGLDPVMRDVFIEIIKNAKSQGKTVIMSSHMFNELEPTCDRIAFLKQGKIIDIIDRKQMDQLKEINKVTINFATASDYATFASNKLNFQKLDPKKKTIVALVEKSELNQFLDMLATVKMENIFFDQLGLDDYFEEKIHGEAI